MSSKAMPLLLQQMSLLTVMVMLSGVEVVRGYPSGPPPSACEDMFPQGHGVDAKTIAPPYTLSATPTIITAGATVTLILAATGDGTFPNYKGMFVQARRADCESDEPIGTFTVPQDDDFLKLMTCAGTAGSAVSHKAASPHTTKTFTWTAPDTYQGRIYFRATVVNSKENFWTNVFSPYLKNSSDTSQAPADYCPVRSKLNPSSVPALYASLVFTVVVSSFTMIFNS